MVRRPAQRGSRCAERVWISLLMLNGPDTNNAAFHNPRPVVINLLKTFSTMCFFRPLSTAACSNGPRGTRRGLWAGKGKRERQFQWTFLILCPLKKLQQKKTLDTAAQSSDSFPVCWAAQSSDSFPVCWCSASWVFLKNSCGWHLHLCI